MELDSNRLKLKVRKKISWQRWKLRKRFFWIKCLVAMSLTKLMN